jgi:hypothetical protein
LDQGAASGGAPAARPEAAHSEGPADPDRCSSGGRAVAMSSVGDEPQAVVGGEVLEVLDVARLRVARGRPRAMQLAAIQVSLSAIDRPRFRAAAEIRP